MKLLLKDQTKLVVDNAYLGLNSITATLTCKNMEECLNVVQTMVPSKFEEISLLTDDDSYYATIGGLTDMNVSVMPLKDGTAHVSLTGLAVDEEAEEKLDNIQEQLDAISGAVMDIASMISDADMSAEEEE